MKNLVLLLFLLAAPVAEPQAYDITETLITLAELNRVEPAEHPEGEILNMLQTTIEDARQRMDAYEPAEPEKIRKMFADEPLTIRLESLRSDGCTAGTRGGPVTVTRDGDELRFEGFGDREDAGPAIWISDAEASSEILDTLLALALKTAAVPPPFAQVAKSTPAKLLAHGRRLSRSYGGPPIQISMMELRSGDEHLRLTNQTSSALVQETEGWIRSTKKAVLSSSD